jgi:histone acetyltransferase (RNA polymerase elongator complex component)
LQSPVEVAFYGGTFTALPCVEQERFLSHLHPYRLDGTVGAIRISTRPDALTPSILSLLQQGGVSMVELGVQSLDDEVLLRAGRGHDAAAVTAAAELLGSYGIPWSGHLMPGLPAASPHEPHSSLNKLLELRPAAIRIHPALVLADTPLAELYAQGEYEPLTMDQAIHICKAMLWQCLQQGVPVIRLGLHPDQELLRPGTILAGPFHPAMRHLAQSALWLELMVTLAGCHPPEGEVTLYSHPAAQSELVGHRRQNILHLSTRYGVQVKQVKVDHELSRHELRLISSRGEVTASVIRDLAYDDKGVLRV